MKCNVSGSRSKLAALYLTLARTYGEIARELDPEARVADGAEEHRVATDAEMDAQYGDPSVRLDPRQGWNGESMVGRRMSECPTEYLNALASFHDWSLAKNLRKAADESLSSDERSKHAKYARYARDDGALARGWAKRNAGKTIAAPKRDVLPPDANPFNAPDADDINF